MPLAPLADRSDTRSASAEGTPAPAASGDERPAAPVIRPRSAALAGPGSEPRRRAELVRRELRARYPSVAPTTAPSVADRSDRTLFDVLLRSRLIHREARLRLVLAALRDRTRELDRDDTRIPEPLMAAIADFEQELADVRERLHNGAPLSAARDSPPADEYAESRQMEGQG